VSKSEVNTALYGKRSKFNVDQSEAGREKRTCDGVVFASIREMKAYQDYVKPNIAIGLFSDLKMQVRYPLYVTTPNGFQVKVGTYIADFVATGRDGKPVVIEAKGHQTPLYKRSKKHFESQYGIRITEI
jgi:hypothetical protein